MLAMEENVSKYTNAIGSGKQAITQGQKRKGGRGMREGWEYKKLGEVASSELGKTLNKSKDTGKLYPYICAVNVLWDMIDLTILKHAFFEKEEIDRYSVRKGDLLVCEGGDTGRSAIWEKEEPVLYQNAIHRVRFTTEMEARFAMYCLWHLKNNGQIDQKYSKGVTIKHLVKSSLLSIELPVPPLSTQHTIVSELDKINELIRLKKEQLKDYDNLAQSIFYEMFGDPVVNERGWEVKKLGELSDLICNGNTPKGGSEVYVDTGFLFLRSQNVWKNRIELDDVAFIDEATHKSLKKSSLKHNDLLITKTGRINTENSSLGRTALFEGEDNSANINGHVYLVRLKDGMVHKFVLYILISNSYRELIRKTCVGGIDKRQLNKDHIEDFPIIFPPIELQKKYVERIELIEKQKEQVRSTIQDLDTLLASRMQYWFD